MFLLGNSKPETIDGVTLYLRQYVTDEGTVDPKYYIVDDKNIPAPTLSKRRLLLLNQDIHLKKLKTAIFFVGDLIKVAKPTAWFIDSNGEIFRYQKSKLAKLVFRKITRKILIPSGGALLEIEGVPGRLKCLFTPRASENYAGVIFLNMSYILYGVYEELHTDTWRKI